MSLRHAVLAALIDREASGYDLAKQFHVSVADYWTATSQQLYRELDRMAVEGLLSARVVPQDGRPDKRVYALTDDGVAALRAFTQQEPRPTTVRDELLVQVEALVHADVVRVRASIEARIAASADRLADYESRRLGILGDRSEEAFLATGRRVGPYLTLLRGIGFEQENIAWGRRALAVIDLRMDAAGRLHSADSQA